MNYNPKMSWDGIKLLSGLSNPPPITSIAVNGTVLSDFDLAVAINESFCSVADDIAQLNFTPIPVLNIPEEFIITRDAVEAGLLSVQNSALTTNFHILVSRGGGWFGISRTIQF